jgi:hypothetical protein
MINWIKGKVIKWVRDDWNQVSKSSGVVATRDGDRPEQQAVLNFRIYGAVNGQILEFSKYDRKNDQHTSTMYVIEKDKDVGEYVAKCLSVELLK